jgi:tetratricopeptide (TPR) repeat protein
MFDLSRRYPHNMGSMRRFLFILSLLAAICATTSAFAQSDALKKAWQQTEALYADGKYTEAETWAKKAVDLAQTESGADSINYALGLNNLAYLYVKQGRYAEAEPLYKRALAIREKVLGPDHPNVAGSLNNLASLYESQGRYAEAEPLYQRALAIREKALGPDHPDVAASLNYLAGLYVDQGRYAEAEPLSKRALAIDEKAFGPDHSEVAASLNILALLYDAQGRFAEAEPLFKRALGIWEKVLGPEHPTIAVGLNNLALLYVYQGRYAEAEPLYKRALAINEKALGPDHPDVAISLNNLAGLYLAQGRYAEAEPLYQRALAIDEKALGPDDPDLATDLNNLALLYRMQGRYADAEPLYQRALAIWGKVLGPDHPDVAISLNNLALLYWKQGRYTDAEPLYQRALAIREKALGPDHTDVAQSLKNLALLYNDQGRYAEAEPLYKRALTIYEKALGPDHPDVAQNLNDLAKLYDDQGRYADAEPLDKRALTIREKTLGADHPDVATSLNNLAEVYDHQGRYGEALPLIRRAAAISASRVTGAKEESKGGQSELRSRRGIFLEEVTVMAHLIMANDPQSPQLREEGFAALQWSKASDTAAAVSHMAARFAAGSDALAALVRQREDTGDRLDATEAAILKSVSQPPEKRDAKAEADLRADADSLHQNLTQLDDELAAKFPAYAELANPKPVTIAETQKLLAPDQALIVFAVGPKESYVAVVGPDSYRLDIVPVGAKDLTATVKALRRTLNPEGKTSVPPFDASDAYKLYQQLLAPAEPALKGVTQLYVVTDGALESLPLGVLLTEKPSADTLSAAAPDQLRAAPWLARRYAVSVLPSVSSLKALRQFSQAAHAPQPFMGFGDPVLKPQPGDNRGAPDVARGGTVKSVFRGDIVDQAELRDLPSLPETAGELRAEAKLFKAGPGSVLLLEAATVTAVKHADLSSRRIIAFATHGLLAGDVGVAEPGLVLTPPAQPTPEDDGLLKASEIAQLKLNADLVILSACNTAASDGTPGAEGFSGLSKAFLYAGARSLMVSNWSVVSGSTVALMTRMAAHLEEKSVGRAEALRRAELDLMDDKDHPEFAHPLFWAPFVVVGEGGAVKE